MKKMVNSGTASNQGESLGKGSKNKRKLADPSLENTTDPGSPLTVFPQRELSPEMCPKLSDNVSVDAGLVQPKEEVEAGAFECTDWDDPIVCQLEELLLSYLQAILQSAIKQVAECGYSEEVAEKAVSRGGLYIGGKDPLSNIVNDTLEFLNKGKGFDASRDNEFGNLQHLVEYTMLEMISVLREVRPSLSVAEAMWWLLICDLNILQACTSEGDPLSAIGFEESSRELSSDSSSTQLRSEATSFETIHPNPNPNQANSSTPPLSHAQERAPQNNSTEALKFGSFPNVPNSKHSHAPGGLTPEKDSLSSMLDSLEKCLGFTEEYMQNKSQTCTSEEKSGAVRKWHTKKELAALRRKSFHMERNYRAYGSKGGFKSGKVTVGGFFVEKRMKPPSELPGARTTVGSSKSSAQGGATIPSSDGRHHASTSSPSASPATGCSSTVPEKGTISSLPSADTKFSQKSGLEEISGPKTPVCTSESPKILDYCAGIPYDKSLGKYVPQDEKDELILKLVPRLEELQNELQGWTKWANEKVMQVSRRLSKERPELKTLRQEKEEAEQFKKEKLMLEENTMKRLSELEHALNNATGQVERAKSNICRLEVENSTLKKKLLAAKKIALEKARRHLDGLDQEQRSLKRAQAWEGEISSLQEELETEKKKVASLQQDLGKAKSVHHQIEARWKWENTENEKLLAHANSIRNEREQREALAKVEEDRIKQKAENDMQKYMEDIKELESKLSEFQLKSDSSRIAALRRGAAGSFGGCLSDRKTVMATKGTQNFTSIKRVMNSEDYFGTGSLRQDRECVMCLSEEMSVVFLPCAHQVVCAKCNELHKKQGMEDCPSCRTPIQRRINVQYAHP
ncbi:hypothetical protein ACE6H2_028627 [Prunus campanulata]